MLTIFLLLNLVLMAAFSKFTNVQFSWLKGGRVIEIVVFALYMAIMMLNITIYKPERLRGVTEEGQT